MTFESLAMRNDSHNVSDAGEANRSCSRRLRFAVVADIDRIVGASFGIRPSVTLIVRLLDHLFAGVVSRTLLWTAFVGVR